MNPQVAMTSQTKWDHITFTLSTLNCGCISLCCHPQCLYRAYLDVLNVYLPSADVWDEGNLPSGWREISDSSEVYFWHIPTGTTQYDRPVTSVNQQTPSISEPDPEPDPQKDTQESLELPNEVRAPSAPTHLRVNHTQFLYIKLPIYSQCWI